MSTDKIKAATKEGRALWRKFEAEEAASAQAPARKRRGSQLVGSDAVVVLSAEDIRNLKEAAGRRGYAVPRFNPRTGTMLTAQWSSWKKLQRKRLADIEGSGEAEDLVITPAGRMALKQHNIAVSQPGQPLPPT